MFSQRRNKGEKAMSGLPQTIEELISEYEGNGTFRVPKDISTLRLCFEIDNSTLEKPNTYKCIEIPVSAGLWVMERTPYSYGSRTLVTFVFHRKEDTLPLAEAKMNVKSRFDQIASMTVCAGNKILFKVPMEDYELYSPVKMGEKGIALPFRRISTKEFQAYGILNFLILQKAIDHNKDIPLRIHENQGALVLTGITPKNLKNYVPKLKVEHDNEFKKYGAELSLKTLGGIGGTYDLVIPEVGDGDVLNEVERKQLAPPLKDLLCITDLTTGLDTEQFEDSEFIPIFDRALQDAGIRQAFNNIMTMLEYKSKKEADAITHKDFLSLLPLLSYDTLVNLGQWVRDRYDKEGNKEDNEGDEDNDNENEEKKVSSGPIFAGLVFAVSGKMSKPQGEIKDLIAKNGGELKSSVTKAVTHVLANEIGSGKTQKALDEGKKIVTEEWLFDSIKAGRLLTSGRYFLI